MFLLVGIAIGVLATSLLGKNEELEKKNKKLKKKLKKEEAEKPKA